MRERALGRVRLGPSCSVGPSQACELRTQGVREYFTSLWNLSDIALWATYSAIIACHMYSHLGRSCVGRSHLAHSRTAVWPTSSAIFAFHVCATAAWLQHMHNAQRPRCSIHQAHPSTLDGVLCVCGCWVCTATGCGRNG